MSERQEFDDLIFENRNREYGAYFLRRNYNSLVVRGLILGIIIISSIVLIPYLKAIALTKGTDSRRGERYVSMQMEKIDQPEEEINLPEAPPPPPVAAPQLRYVAPVVVDSVLPTEKALPTVADVQAAPPSNTEEITVSTSTSENELVGDPDGTGDDEPFILVEVKPTFKGGDIEAFRQWVMKKVVYPQEAQDNGIQGRVYLTFVVERDGTVSTVNIVRTPDELLSKAASDAILASPKWSPGLQRGRPVRVRFSIYLNFTL
jgi:protein TonB